MRVLLLSLLFISSAEAQWWKVQTSGLDTNLRGVSVARVSNAKSAAAAAVWASGSNGVILKSIDEGATWKRVHVAGGEALDFRGIVAFNASTAYVMSSGEGEKSRIYKTTDGGESWTLQYTDKRKEFFLDTIACVSETHCLALGDPLNSRFLLLITGDGEHWNPLPSPNMPAALPGEGAFAASNTCLLLSGEEIFFGTGGPAARVFRSSDSGRTWTVVETPIAHGTASSGIFSVARVDEKEIVVVGGDYQDPKRASAVAAYSLDEGRTWQLSEQQPGGYRSSVACLGDGLCVTIGPNGEDVSVSKIAAALWKPADSLNLNAAAIPDGKHGWAVGPNGTIARFINHAIPKVSRSGVKSPHTSLVGARESRKPRNAVAAFQFETAGDTGCAWKLKGGENRFVLTSRGGGVLLRIPLGGPAVLPCQAGLRPHSRTALGNSLGDSPPKGLPFCGL